MEEKYYTAKQAAELTHLSEVTIKRKVKEGLIPKVPWSGKILIPGSFFESCKKEKIISLTS